MTKLQELQAKLKEKSAVLADIFKQAGPDMDLQAVKHSAFNTCEKTQDRTEKIRELNNELAGIGKEIDEMMAIAKMASDTMEREKLLAGVAKSVVHPGGMPGNDGGSISKSGNIITPKSMGQMFVESGAFKNHKQKEVSMLGDTLELKTLFQTSAGWSPETTRTGRIVFDAQRPVQVVDIIPIGNTNQSAVVYMEETTFTNNAAETSEGGSFPEAALAYTERTSTVRKISVFIPVTDEMLEDEARIASLLDNRLRFMLQQRLDLQILVGNGTAPNLEGINNVTNILTQAKGVDNRPDAIYKGITQIRVTGQAEPNAYVTHPNDWQPIRLLQTADGIYIWGSPSDAGPARIWGLPVLQAQAQTENTGLLGDYANFVELVMRKGVEVQISDSHDDYFVKGKKAIRASLRAALPTYRAEAFCQITGI